jgi:hypothetical protein
MIGQREGTLLNYFDGLIDELIVDDIGYSAAQVLDIYNNGIGGNKGGND